MKQLVNIVLCGALAAQLPQPSFPPITFNVQASPNCYGQQLSATSLDAQKSQLYRSVGAAFSVGEWVTYSSWCENLVATNYPIFLCLDVAQHFYTPCDGVASQITVPGAAPSYDQWFLQNAITVTPTHMQVTTQGTAVFFFGFQLPNAALGCNILSQWIRLDPNGLLYLGNLQGYSVLN